MKSLKAILREEGLSPLSTQPDYGTSEAALPREAGSMQSQYPRLRYTMIEINKIVSEYLEQSGDPFLLADELRDVVRDIAS